MILAGDIGGTNARLALCSSDGRRIVRQDAIPSRAQPSLERIVKVFLGPRPPAIRAATLGIAGPVVNVPAAQGGGDVAQAGVASGRTWFMCCGGNSVVDVTTDAGKHWWQAFPSYPPT